MGSRLWSRAWDGTLQDLRYTLRGYRRSPGFAVFAILILALGIGANAAVFGVVHTLLMKPLPFGAPDRLVWIANTGTGGGLSSVTSRTSNLRDWRRLSGTFDELGGYFAFFDYGGYNLTGDGVPERLVGVGITETFLDVLGVQPMLGRGFVEEECVWNGRKAALLTYGFWQRRYGADPSIVGRSIVLNDAPTLVVGVLPPSFDFASIFTPGVRVDLLTPFPVSDETDRWGNTLAIVGRLKPGVSAGMAERELLTINEQLKQADPGRWGLGASVTSLQEKIAGQFRRALVVLLGAVGVVLLIACTNLSNLLLVRAAARRREIAIRSAIGATRWRLIRQMLTESVVLSACGAALGILMAVGLTRALASTRAISMPLLQTVGIDGATLAFTAAIAAGTSLLFGLAPALQMSGRRGHVALNDAARGSSDSAGGSWARATLMVAQVALACMLVIGAGLLLRSFATLLDVDLGFDPDGAAAWRIESAARYGDHATRLALYERLVREVAAIPGVESVGLTDSLPLGRNRSWGVRARGATYAQGENPIAFPRMVDTGYFTSMRIPLVEGRRFTLHDDADSERVMIVNETMARRLWPGRDAVGRIAQLGSQDWLVVGVVANVRHGALEQDAGLEMYMPIAQQRDWGSLDLVVRTRVRPEAVAASVRAAIQTVDPLLPAGELTLLGALVDRAVSPRRFVLQVLSAFALAALVLASLGIYGVVSYSVGQREQELGIRMALGATSANVIGYVMWSTLGLSAVGLAAGVAGSLALSYAMESLLFGVTPTDPVTFAGTACSLGLVALVAAYLPARRAARVEVAAVLRGG